MQFLSYMMTAVGQVSVLAILVVVGYLCDKTKLFTQAVSKACNDLLFYIVTPATIIHSFLNVEFNPQNGRSFLGMFAIMAVFHTAGCLMILPLYKKSGENRPLFQYASMYGNVGYMGLPLAKAVAGDMGVFFCSAAVAVFNIFAFSHGIHLMRREKEGLQFKKLLVNPGTKKEDIKEIYSHEQAINQCSEFLHNLPGVKVIPVGNTAVAASMVAWE